MHFSSSYKFLYLLNLLFEKDCTKKEFLKEFEKIGIKTSSSAINNYIDKLIKNGIKIEILKNKNKNVYHINKPLIKLDLTEDELSAIQDVKKLLFAQKNYNKIRKVVRLFYKLIFAAKGDELKSRLLDFGYYSSLNWHLVRTLEKHCKTKDIIQIDYMLADGLNKKLIIHVDDLKIGDWSNKLYLWGVLANTNHLSYLPVDRIYMIEKIIRKNVPIEPSINTLTYKISKKLFEEIQLNSKEKLVSLDEKYATITRPLEDNFYIIQRLMSFCPDLYYISDEKIKNMVKEKLKILKAAYEKEYE